MSEFDLIFNDRTPEEEIQDEARLLMYRFLDIIERKCDSLKWSKKMLAKEVGTSPSFITQLFRGDKLINLPTIIKMKQALAIDFEIKEKQSYSEEKQEEHSPFSDGKGFWVYTPFKTPNYSIEEGLPEIQPNEKAA